MAAALLAPMNAVVGISLYSRSGPAKGATTWQHKPLNLVNHRLEDIKKYRPSFLPKLKRKTAGYSAGMQADNSMVCNLRETYFSVPLDHKFRYLQTLLNTWLFNMRDPVDNNGCPVTYSLTEPPLDPSELMALSSRCLSDALAVMHMGQDGRSPN